MTEMVTTCDVCGTTKGTTNHWFRVFINDPEEFAMFPWSYQGADDRSQTHACSDQCVTKIVQQWLDGQKAASETSA